MFRKKRAVKYSYKITFVSASGVEDGSFVHIAWKRGSKSANHGETEQKEASNGSVDWNETITIPCTLFKSSGTSTGYDPKELSLSLTSFDLEKKKDVVLGKIIVDLASFADSKEPQTKYHNVKAAKKITGGPFVLVVIYAPVLVGEGGDDEAMSETDNGAVSDEEEEPTASEDPFAAENMAAASTGGPAATPKKAKSIRRSKKSAASTSALIVTSIHDTSSSPKKSASPVPTSGSSEKLADVIRERDELRQTVESLKSKSGRRRGSSASGSDLVDIGTLQKQISSLRAEKIALEQDLSDTREELAVKTSAEDRITTECNDAQEQLTRLRASVKDGSSLGDNAVLIKAFEARILSLENERKSLKKEFELQGERFRGENRALRSRIGELEEALDQANSRSKSKGEVEVLQKQNKQLMKKWDVLNELFDAISNISYSSSGKPMTSTLIADFIRKSQPDDPATVTPVSGAIRMALNAPMKDFRMPLLWVSTLHYTLQDLGQSVATIPAPETLGFGEGKTAADAIMRLLVRAFNMTLDSIYRVIEPACRDSFITPSSDSSNAVVNILADVSAAAKDVHLAPSIRKQLISQIVYDIDATVFNVLIGDKTLCSCDRVLKIRQAMSSVERWLLKDAEISAAKRQLQLIREVANLFMIDESVLSDDDAINAAFSVLNIRQIAILLEMFKPDEMKKETVDPNLIRDLKVKAVEAGDKAPLEVDGHRWYNLPKEKTDDEKKEDKKKGEEDSDEDSEDK